MADDDQNTPPEPAPPPPQPQPQAPGQQGIPTQVEQSDPYSAGEPQEAPRQRKHVEHKDEDKRDRMAADPATGYQYDPETKYDVQGVYNAATQPQDFQKDQAPIQRLADTMSQDGDPVSNYAQRKHAMPAEQINKIDEANGGQKDPHTVYRSVGSLTDPADQYGYLMGKAKLVDTAVAIARSLSGGEHGPVNYPGAVNALNEAAKATPDGNHINATQVGDKTVFNISPVDEAHKVKTVVVPSTQLPNIAPAFHFDNAMQDKLVPALTDAEANQRMAAGEQFAQQNQNSAAGGMQPQTMPGSAQPQAAPGGRYSQPLSKEKQQQVDQYNNPGMRNNEALNPGALLKPQEREMPRLGDEKYAEDLKERDKVPEQKTSADEQAQREGYKDFADKNRNPKAKDPWQPHKQYARDTIINRIDEIQRGLKQQLTDLGRGSASEHVTTSHNQKAHSEEVTNPAGIAWGASQGKGTSSVTPHAIPQGGYKTSDSSATSNQQIEQGQHVEHPDTIHSIATDMQARAQNEINKLNEMLRHIDQGTKDSKGQPLVMLEKNPNNNWSYQYNYNRNSEEGLKLHNNLITPAAPYSPHASHADATGSSLEASDRSIVNHLMKEKQTRELTPRENEIVERFIDKSHDRIVGGGGGEQAAAPAAQTQDSNEPTAIGKAARGVWSLMTNAGHEQNPFAGRQQFKPPSDWQYSPSRQQYRDAQGNLYDSNGRPVGR